MCPARSRPRTGIPTLAWAFVLRAGDENRTRTISLGIRPIRAARAAGQPGPGTASSRECPLFTGANCTVITSGRPRFHRAAGWWVPNRDGVGSPGQDTA
jgi:hypothetical protein